MTVLSRALRRLEATRARARTRRILESLPRELQADVGYPACLERH